MKVLKIVVDMLPNNCRSCVLRTDNYCLTKGLATEIQDSMIDVTSDTRDERCPLKSRESQKTHYSKC